MNDARALLSIIMVNSLHSPDTVLQDQAGKSNAAVAEAQRTPKKSEGGQMQFPEKCELKIQVIDGTALIEPSRRVREIKSDKKPKRRVRKNRKKKESLDKGGEKKGKESVMVMYSRKEMEAMRFENLEDQKRKWIEVYCALGAPVAAEYDGLVDAGNNHRPKNIVPNLNFNPRPAIQNSANLFAVAAMVKANPLIVTAH